MFLTYFGARWVCFGSQHCHVLLVVYHLSLGLQLENPLVAGRGCHLQDLLVLRTVPEKRLGFAIAHDENS